MITKINRQDCIDSFPSFPLYSYDRLKDEDYFSYPKAFKMRVLILPSKTFKGHARQLGEELVKLVKPINCDSLIFLGESTTAWLYQYNEYKPAREAYEYLAENKVGKRYNGALKVTLADLAIFIRHLAWFTRCNAVLPTIYFMDEGQRFLGNICKHGNVHIDSLNKNADKQLKAAITKTALTQLPGNICYDQFGTIKAIAGREIVV